MRAAAWSRLEDGILQHSLPSSGSYTIFLPLLLGVPQALWGGSTICMAHGHTCGAMSPRPYPVSCYELPLPSDRRGKSSFYTMGQNTSKDEPQLRLTKPTHPVLLLEELELLLCKSWRERTENQMERREGWDHSPHRPLPHCQPQ